MLLSIVPCVGLGLGLIGLVLILVAVKDISDVLADKSIFKNMLISVILTAIGVIIGFVSIFAIMFSYIREFATLPDPSMLMSIHPFSYLGTILLVVVPIWIFCIGSAVFLKRSYSTIASKLNIRMFSNAASLYLIGAVLAIILIGFIIIFAAGILQAVAFFSIPEETK